MARLESFEPAADTVLAGSVRFKRVRIDRGVTVHVREDLELWSAETIVIDGSLVADATAGDAARQQRHGIGLILTAEGDIDIAGTLVAGPGDAGEAAGLTSVEEIAVSGAGHPGGDVSLVSRTGRVRIRSTASIVAGDGGRGGGARGTGRSSTVAGEPGGHAVAVGGRGGDGGSVRLFGPAGVMIEQKRGLLTLGSGGAGGDASATGGTGGPRAAQIDAGLGGGVYARGGDGGHGGTIPDPTLASLAIVNRRGERVPLDLRLLRTLASGGNGGQAGNTEGHGGGLGRGGAQPAPTPQRARTRRSAARRKTGRR